LRLGGQGNDEPELRPRAHHLRLEAAHAIAGAAVAPEFSVHARELMPGLRIEIGVARAGIDRAMPDADVR